MKFIDCKKKLDILLEEYDSHGDFSVALSFQNENIIINDKKYPSASTIKLLVAMYILKQSEKGKLDLDETVNITHKVGGTGVLNALTNINSISIKDSIILSLIISDNIASNLLLDLLEFKTFNKFIEEIGCKNTILQRKFMDSDALQRGLDNFSSPVDMLTALETIAKKSFLSQESNDFLMRALENQQLKTGLGGSLDFGNEEIRLYNKTGNLYKLEHDVGIFKVRDEIVCVSVFSNNLSSNKVGRDFINEVGNIIINFLNRGIYD